MTRNDMTHKNEEKIISKHEAGQNANGKSSNMNLMLWIQHYFSGFIVQKMNPSV